jgi:hypothetical protein
MYTNADGNNTGNSAVSIAANEALAIAKHGALGSPSNSKMAERVAAPKVSDWVRSLKKGWGERVGARE